MIQMFKKLFREEVLTTVFVSVCTILYAILFYYSMGTIWENIDIRNEFVYFKPDALLNNTVGILLIALGVYFLTKWMNFLKLKINKNGCVSVVCILSALFGIYWVYASHTVPQSDQALVCGYASLFNMGDITGLYQGEYVGRYQYQLGLITFIRILFRIFGDQQFQAVQYFSAFMLPVIIFSGYKITGIISEHNAFAEMYYVIAIVLCVPLYGYVPFVYGEIGSLAFILLAVWMFLKCLNHFSWGKLLVLILTAGCAVQFRQNTLVVVVAMLIVVAIKLLGKNRKYHYALTGCGILLGVILGYSVIGFIYHDYIPKDSKTTPSSLFVAMGTNDSENLPGWHNGYDHHVYALSNYDVDKANQIAWADIGAFVDKCRENPDYAIDFYYRKLNTQWNSPMYQCLSMNNKFEGEQSKFVQSVYYGKTRFVLEDWMNLYQIVIYGSILFLLLRKRKEWKQIEKCVLLIAVFGGFFLSMIWEAKPRYVFPYFIMMIPYAAIGISEMFHKIEYWRKAKSYEKRGNNTDVQF